MDVFAAWLVGEAGDVESAGGDGQPGSKGALLARWGDGEDGVDVHWDHGEDVGCGFLVYSGVLSGLQVFTFYTVVSPWWHSFVGEF